MDEERHVNKKKVRMWMKEDEKRKKEKGVSERVILRMKNEQD
jgi:hypothetical protein